MGSICFLSSGVKAIGVFQLILHLTWIQPAEKFYYFILPSTLWDSIIIPLWSTKKLSSLPKITQLINDCIAVQV